MREFIRDYNERHGATVLLDQPLHGRRRGAVPARHRDRPRAAHLRRRPARRWCGACGPTSAWRSASSAPVDARDARHARATVVSADGAQAVLSVPARRSTRVVRDALATLPVVDLTVEDPPLEEVMRELFSAQPEGARHGQARSAGDARPVARAIATGAPCAVARLPDAAARRPLRGRRLPRRVPGLDADHDHAARHAGALARGRRATAPVGRFDQTEFIAYFLATLARAAAHRHLGGLADVTWRSATARCRRGCCARCTRCSPTAPSTWRRVPLRALVVSPIVGDPGRHRRRSAGDPRPGAAGDLPRCRCWARGC